MKWPVDLGFAADAALGVAEGVSQAARHVEPRIARIFGVDPVIGAIEADLRTSLLDPLQAST